MKVLLVLPASPSSAPYLQYYIDILAENNVDYDLCFWNRNNDGKAYPLNYNAFAGICKKDNAFFKLYLFIKFQRYIKRFCANDKYDFVIVFTLQMAFFLSSFLLSNFRGKFLIDIRDYTFIMRLPFVRRVLWKTLNASVLNCISSSGFKKWLPTGKAYCLSHNVNCSKIVFANNASHDSVGYPIKILTIGALRDLESNINLIDSLYNDNRFILIFSGQGPATMPTSQYVVANSVNNVVMTGAYEKSQENAIIADSDMMNILLSNDINSKTLMANRFYLSVLNRKPMIVSANTESAFYVEKFSLGLIVYPGDDIKMKILHYWDNFDFDSYNVGCNEFIELVKSDELLFEKKISNILNGYVDI